MKSLLAGATLGLLALLACRREAPKAPPEPPRVRVETVEGGTSTPLELRGSVAAEGRLKLGFKQAGVLASVLVREGDRVRKGQPLAQQDEVDARALQRTAQAGVDKARRDADRAERLVREGALPRSVHEDARTALEAAEAQLSQASDLLERTRLLAPVAGTIFARVSEPGEMVGSGNPVLLLDSTEAPVVRAGASAREAAVLKVGQRVLLALEGQEGGFEGRVRSLGASPNPADGLYPLEVTPTRGNLRIGALVRLTFPGSLPDPQPSISLEALVRREDKDHVFVLEGGVVRLREVQVQRSEGRRVRIRAGLKPGERVVGEGAYFLQDGQAVRVAE